MASLVACSRGAAVAADGRELDQATIERLRALGYDGFTEDKVSPGERERPVTVLDSERSAHGYRIFTNRNLASAHLIDSLGAVVHSWQDRGARHWSHVELVANGDILVPGSLPAQPPNDARRFLLRMSWDGRVVFRSMINAHHDAEITPDNRVACLTYRFRNIPEISRDVAVKDDLIAILSLQGEVVETYSLFDLLGSNPDEFSFQSVAVVERRSGKFIDLLHANSLEFMRHPHLESKHPMYASTNVLVSFRHQDTIAIFDWKAKRLVWAWGQGEISGQHDATVLENGNILLFDNGLNRSWSRVLELNPVTRKIVWEYRAPVAKDFFSLRRGAAQRMPNGNTLVANSDSGEAFEVTPAGETVWRFLNPNVNGAGNRATIVRIKHFPKAYFQGLLEPGLLAP